MSKKSVLHVQRTIFLYFSLPLLLHDHSVKLSRYMFYEGNVLCSHKKIGCLGSFSLSFSMPRMFSLQATNISHFLTSAIKFLCFVSNEICLLCLFVFISRSSSFSVIRVSLVENETQAALFCFVFFFPLRPGPHEDDC